MTRFGSAVVARRGQRQLPARGTARRPEPRRRTGAAAPAGTPLDGGVVASVALLAALGLVMVYSATAPLALGDTVPPLALRHVAALALGVAVAATALRLPLAFWRRCALPGWAAGTALLALTAVLGVDANGARRWLAIPGLPFHFQPAELARLATLFAVAAALSRDGRRTPEDPRTLLRALVLACVPAGLLLLQPDFGSAALLVALVGLLLFVAGTPLRWLSLSAAVGVAGTALYAVLQPYALARFKGFLSPWESSRDEGFQLVQSFVAFGRGGSFGAGLGDGRQKLFYLPEAHTDFILSVIAEELGLAGVLVVLGSFAAFLLAGMRIARRARSRFAVLVATGATGFVALPAAVNAAVVMGMLPTTGFTLPFVSYGGNSIVACSLAVGVLLRVAAHEARPGRARVAGAGRPGAVRRV